MGWGEDVSDDNNPLIKFKMDGPRFKEAIPLREVIVALTEFQSIIDKSYLATVNRNRLTPQDKKNYAIVATDIGKGSLTADIQIFVATAVQTLPHVPFETYKNIWEIVKGSYDFLKALAVKRSSGVEPVINIAGSNNAPIIIGNNITISNTVFTAADRAESHFKKITSIINPGEIDYIQSFDGEGLGFKMTMEDKNLFHPKTRLDKEVFTVECDIYKYDKVSHIGRVRVFEGQALPAMDYQFRPILNSDGYLFIQAMGMQSVRLNVMREIEIHTTGVERISSLRVASIEGMSEPTLFM